ncbi:hypothetical protein KIH39_22765 [Telmatocola sphagniphila]|uniref:DUF6900 domain-containing protein n=1 Tax=Telmatocola sphagniphila TaxID=1123043 RepID=A0A8E6B5B4_9BACT|nr:hypothetical protein [Telmatocola sphagniphila]QVL31637.1 hypothetical protein KIH39_22765 [Telmatocola sphagniphila]
MTTLDELLTDIASKHLQVRTLQTRMSDALDFHEVSVWGIKNALLAAFEAGAKTGFTPSVSNNNLLTRFDDYEIQPCRRYILEDEPDRSYVEPCEGFEADFWTLYGHITGEGVQAIGDFGTRRHAEEVFAKITGRSYSSRKQPKERR